MASLTVEPTASQNIVTTDSTITANNVTTASESSQLTIASYAKLPPSVDEAINNSDFLFIHYTSLTQLFASLDTATATPDKTLYFSDVPEDLPEKFVRATNRGCKYERFRRVRYTYIASASGIFIVVLMAGLLHEGATGLLSGQIHRLGFNMGLKKNLAAYGMLEIDIGNTGSRAIPDFCFYGNGKAAGPTAVFEVAVAQSVGSLKVKGALWCTLPSVKVLVLIKLDTAKHTITITKLLPSPQCQHNYNTRNAPSPHGVVVACVHIQPVQDTVPQVYELDPNADQAITLAYGDITNEAAPAGGPHDFVFDSDFFLEWAEDVWAD